MRSNRNMLLWEELTWRERIERGCANTAALALGIAALVFYSCVVWLDN